MQEWFLNNGIQVATLLSLFVFIAKASKWAGIQENRATNLEGWLKSHVENHPCKSK